MLGVKDIPAKPNTPYVLIGELPSQPHHTVEETSRAQDHYFQVFAYDKPGTMARIDAIMAAVRETVRELSGQVSPSGLICLEATWQGASQDFVEQSENKLVKFATVKLTANG